MMPAREWFKRNGWRRSVPSSSGLELNKILDARKFSSNESIDFLSSPNVLFRTTKGEYTQPSPNRRIGYVNRKAGLIQEERWQVNY